MLIGTAPNQVDIKNVSTQRLLAYKKKNFAHAKCFNRSNDFACEWCKENDASKFKHCTQYHKDYEEIRAELATREHIEK